MLTTKGQWQNLAEAILNKFTKHAFLLDNISIKNFSKSVQNPFWKQILMDWTSLQLEADNLVLWNNERIKLNRKTLSYNSYIENNIIFAKDLVNTDENDFYSLEQLKTKFPEIRTNFIQYYGLTRLVSNAWKQNLHIPPNEQSNSSFLKEILKTPKANKVIYSHFIIKNIGVLPEVSQQKWEQELAEDLNWEKIYTLTARTTKDQKLKLLQYKIAHRRIATNQFLEKIKIKNSPNCTFCKRDIETIQHLFFHCTYSERILTFIKRKINHATLMQLPGDQSSIILGNKIDDNALNYILLCYKYYIYKCKFQETVPTENQFLNFLKEKISIEKKRYQLKNKSDVFIKIWENVDLNYLLS